MDSSAVEDLFESFKKRGRQRILDLVDQDEDENVILEYKGSQSKGSGKAYSDRQLIAKTVSAFLNSYGGVLVMGVDKKDSGQARAESIANLAAYGRSVRNSLHDIVAPPSTYELAVIEEGEGDDKGFIAILIREGKAKPYMALADHHRYFMRSEGRTDYMPEPYVRAPAVAQAAPELVLAVDGEWNPDGTTTGGGGLVALKLQVQNVGNAMARNVAVAYEAERVWGKPPATGPNGSYPWASAAMRFAGTAEVSEAMLVRKTFGPDSLYPGESMLGAWTPYISVDPEHRRIRYRLLADNFTKDGVIELDGLLQAVKVVS